MTALLIALITFALVCLVLRTPRRRGGMTPSRRAPGTPVPPPAPSDAATSARRPPLRIELTLSLDAARPDEASPEAFALSVHEHAVRHAAAQPTDQRKEA